MQHVWGLIDWIDTIMAIIQQELPEVQYGDVKLTTHLPLNAENRYVEVATKKITAGFEHRIGMDIVS
eukprot:1460258-Prorocentrum_lima.AAC.1